MDVGESVGSSEDNSDITIEVGDMDDMTDGVGSVDEEGVIGLFASSTCIGSGVPLGVGSCVGRVDMGGLGESVFASSGVLGASIPLSKELSVFGSGEVIAGAIGVVIGKPVPPGSCK